MPSEEPQDFVYVLVREGPAEEEGPSGEAAMRLWPFKGHEIPVDKIQKEFGKYIGLAQGMLDQAKTLPEGFAVDSITLHLGLDAKVGLGFVGSVGLEGAVDVTVKRVRTT